MSHKNNKCVEILPTSDMNRNEQMNAVPRLLIYMLLLCIIFNANKNVSCVSAFTITFIMALFCVSVNDPSHGTKELFAKETKIKEDFTSDADVFYEGDPEAGYYDSDGG